MTTGVKGEELLIMGYRKGDDVTAKKDMGGVVRDSVPAGSKGTVTQTDGLGNPTRASFRVGDKNVDIRVNNREVR